MGTQQSPNIIEAKINTQLLGIPKEDIRRIDVSEAEVVRRQYLSHIREPQVTIRPDGIQFNNSCIRMMEGTVYIYLMVDRKRKWIIICECEKDARDAQRWCNVKNDARKSRKISGRPFAERLYQLMGWNKGYYYKVCGTPALPVEKEERLFLLFELESYDRFALTEKARENAGVLDEEVGSEELENIRKEAEAIRKAKEAATTREKPRRKKKIGYPEAWNDGSFGVPFQNHKARLQLPKLADNTEEQLSLDIFDAPPAAESPKQQSDSDKLPR